MKQNTLDLYTDYLNVTFGYATATGLSQLLDGDLSHDQVTRALSQELCTSKDLWLQVKPTIRPVESAEGCLVFEDTLIEKLWRDENELISWHYDHSKGRNVKGLNRLNCLYHVNETSIPVALELVRKPIAFGDIKTRKQKRLSEVTKNELRRDRLNTAVRNALKFKWVLFDTWFSSTENMTHIKLTLEKDLVGALKTNRLVPSVKKIKHQVVLPA